MSEHTKHLAFTLFIFFAPRVYAGGTSCQWNNTLTTLTGTTFNIQQKQSVSALTLLLDNQLISNSPGVKSDCAKGGDDTANITQGRVSNVIVGTDGADYLFGTSITGIVYKLGIHCAGTGDNCDGGTRNGKILWAGTTSWLKQSGSWYPWDSDTNWTTYIKVYQTSAYRNSESTDATSKSDVLADYIMGDSTHTAEEIQTDGTLKFHLTGSYPTCDTASVSSSGGTGNTVDLGDYHISDLTTPKDVSFTIKLSNCVLPKDTVTVALNSTNVDPGNSNMLGNTLTSGASTGVGLRIKNSAGTTVKPGGSSYNVTGATGTSVDVKVSASLEKDGSTTVKAGAFSTHAVFSLSYN